MKSITSRAGIGGIGGSVLALSIAMAGVIAVSGPFGAASMAHAESHESDAGRPEGAGNGGAGSGGAGHDDGDQGQGAGKDGAKGPPEGAGGEGQGGPGEDSEGHGPQAGSAAGSQGTQPPWASEGIPEVELGRLSVARSPDQVLDRAYDEALAGFTAEMVDFYNMSISEAVLALSTEFDDLTFIDSPLQNLSLLKDALDGTSVLNTLDGLSNDNDTLMAIFLGVASDKTVPISTNTVIAVTTILGTPITGSAAEALAADAEAIRIAVLAGHG